ncbi:MAG: peptidase M14 [Acidobacteria bacterium]|nr:peptidase M14 [Acidobacteriota bacterium]
MPRQLLRLALFLFAALALQPRAAVAQTPRTQTRREAAAPVVSAPSPRSVLGFEPGDDRTIADWSQITDYFARLDAASDRVRVEKIGETTLGRPLIVATVSAPENIRNLAKYQDIQRRLADPRLVASEAERERLIADGKSVVVISCSIHSTEIVASQMSMRLAYELASAQDAETREILQNTILLLVPSANPDGVQIVADWYRKTMGTPYEGTEPPEIYHHYAGHDDNRDWFMLNLRESQALTRLFWKEWFPEVVYDIHQQGSTSSRFFVPPFFDPPNPHIAPLLLREVGLVGHKIAADEEAAGVQGVITNALYDTWWHGGFRTAPYFHNSVGILTEAASARLMTPVNVTREQLARSSTRGMDTALPATPQTNFPDPWQGGTWRARDIMRMELISSRAVLSLAAKYRARYLRNFYELGQRQLDLARAKDAPLGYVVPPGQGRDESAAKLIGTLVAQGVEVYRLEREMHGLTATQRLVKRTVQEERPRVGEGEPGGDERAAGAQREARGATREVTEMETVADEAAREIPAGSYFVPLAQPQRANVLALFEPQVYPDRRTASGAAERPYDVAGWTLPLQMGVESKLLLRVSESAAQRRMTQIKDESDVRRDLGLALRSGAQSPVANPLARAGVRLGLYKSWTGSMDEGWTRYVFDTFNVRYDSVLDRDVRAGNLRARYDVIVLPSMRMREIVEGRARGTAPEEFTGGITEAGVENLRRFVEDGGTLVCFDASTELAIKRFKLPLRNVLEGVRSSEFYCPGSVLRLDVDTSNPLARGLQRDTDAYFINSSAFDVTGEDKTVRVVARYAPRDVLQSGWLLGEEYVAGKVALAEVSMGRGRVVLFGFRPQHRGQTWGTLPFVWNAIASGGGAGGGD